MLDDRNLNEKSREQAIKDLAKRQAIDNKEKEQKLKSDGLKGQIVKGTGKSIRYFLEEL